MKRFLIFSDNHGINIYLKEVLDQIGTDFDGVVQLGDCQNAETEQEIRNIFTCPVYMVAGNCDYFSSLPPVKIVEFGKYRIMLTHGHHYFVSVGPQDLLEDAKAHGCNVVIYGHTHRPLMDGTDEEVLVLNPGSISFPRQEGKKPSYMVMEIDGEGEAHFRLNYL